MQKYELQNGLTYFYEPMLHTHSITLGLYIKTMCPETYSQIGIAHLLEHLHFRHFGKYSQAEIYYLFEKMGTTLRAATYRDFIRFYVKISPDHLSECVDLFCELIETFDWTENDLQQEKKVVINQILEKGSYINIDDESRKAVCAGTFLTESIMGTAEDVQEITLRDVCAYKQKIFCADNILFTVCGNVDEEKNLSVMKKMEKVHLTANKLLSTSFYPHGFGNRKRNVVAIEAEDDGLFDVDIAFDINYDQMNTEHIRILNGILGEGIGSRLQMTVRETNAYTSDIYSFVEWYKDFSVQHIQFSVVTEKLHDCIDAIVKELNGMKNDICQKDLDTTLSFWRTERIFMRDDTQETNFNLSYFNFVLNTGYSLETTIDENQLCGFLQSSAKKLFKCENATVVIVGNKRKMQQRKVNTLLKNI